MSGRIGRFGAGPEYTVGVEEELMLLDRDTLDLVPEGHTVARRLHDGLRVKPEIRSCMIEIASSPWRSSTDVLDELTALRLSVGDTAAGLGRVVAGAGTHPFARPEDQAVTDSPRYAAIMSQAGFSWRRALVFGTHVHVAVGSADKAIGVSEALLADLPVLIALSATSPFWCGQETGLASTRLAVLAGVPRTGLPPPFASFAEYAAGLRTLHRARAVPDASQIWWDVRCQPVFGTVEVRVLDAQPSPRETAALAGLVQALVRWHGRRWDAGIRPAPERFLLAENRWQAVRHGLAARLVGPDGEPAPARELVDRLMLRVADDLGAVGAEWAAAVLTETARGGGRAAGLSESLRRTGDLAAVTRSLLWPPVDQGCSGGGERAEQVG